MSRTGGLSKVAKGWSKLVEGDVEKDEDRWMQGRKSGEARVGYL